MALALEISKPILSGTPPPTRPYLLILSKQSTNWEPVGAFLILILQPPTLSRGSTALSYIFYFQLETRVILLDIFEKNIVIKE